MPDNNFFILSQLTDFPEYDSDPHDLSVFSGEKLPLRFIAEKPEPVSHFAQPFADSSPDTADTLKNCHNDLIFGDIAQIFPTADQNQIPITDLRSHLQSPGSQYQPFCASIACCDTGITLKILPVDDRQRPIPCGHSGNTIQYFLEFDPIPVRDRLHLAAEIAGNARWIYSSPAPQFSCAAANFCRPFQSDNNISVKSHIRSKNPYVYKIVLFTPYCKFFLKISSTAY
jgi:hypothetical protein